MVCDGCTDGTAGALRLASWTYHVVVLSQDASGPAAARNAGAARAEGGVLLFLDDDVEPLPNLLRAHLAFHARHPRGVGVGDLPPQIEADGFFTTVLRGWWLGMHEGPRAGGHRYIFRDLLSGHFSIGREVFRELGGFDNALRCHEDWELGYRAIEAGLDLRFLPEAIALHHDVTTLQKTLGRKFDDGVADVQLIQRYPDLVHDLPLGRPAAPGRRARLLRALAWRRPLASDAMARLLRGALRGCEAARLRFRWRAFLENLLDQAVLARSRGVGRIARLAPCPSRARAGARNAGADNRSRCRNRRREGGARCAPAAFGAVDARRRVRRATYLPSPEPSACAASICRASSRGNSSANISAPPRPPA